MSHRHVLALLLGMLAGAPLLAQDSSVKPPHPCTVEPIFHCARSLDDGSVIARFGYRTTCPESDKPLADLYMPIGDDNYFAPEPMDRGQPTFFMQGEHLDEFEAEFTAEEMKSGKAFGWTVLKIRAPVDVARTKDDAVDCGTRP